MTSEIRIQGPLRFIGYVQDNKAGTNSQVLTYSEGNAVWADVPDSEDAEYNKIITTADTEDVMINRFGDVLTNELTTYVGIDVGTVLEVADSDTEDIEYDKIITTVDTQDVMINRFGEVLINDLTTYVGIDVGTVLEIADTSGLPVISYHHVDYNFSTGQVEEMYAEDGDTVAINDDLTYIVGFVRNEFELQSNGELVYLG